MFFHHNSPLSSHLLPLNTIVVTITTIPITTIPTIITTSSPPQSPRSSTPWPPSSQPPWPPYRHDHHSPPTLISFFILVRLAPKTYHQILQLGGRGIGHYWLNRMGWRKRTSIINKSCHLHQRRQRCLWELHLPTSWLPPAKNSNEKECEASHGPSRGECIRANG